MKWRTSTPSLPLAANSGQYVATGWSSPISLRSASISAATNVIVLVVDQTLMMVSRSQRLGGVGVAVAAPEIDHRFAVQMDGNTGTDVEALVEVRHDGVACSAEP